MGKTKLKSELLKWETPIADIFLPGLSVRHRDGHGVDVFVHSDDPAPGWRLFAEPLGLRITDERQPCGLPQLEEYIGCTVICKHSAWAKENSRGLMKRNDVTHYVLFGGSWTVELLAMEEPIFEEISDLPSWIFEDEV